MTKAMDVAVERMVVTRIFNAPRELVWKAWTEPEYAMRWWGPKGFTSPVCKIDFRVGGKYLFCMKPAEGQEFWTGGEYHEIVLHEKIVMSMYFADAEGNEVKAADLGIEHEAIAGALDVVSFEDLGGGRTKLTYTGNEPMEDATESGQVEGWKQILDKLAEVVEGEA